MPIVRDGNPQEAELEQIEAEAYDWFEADEATKAARKPKLTKDTPDADPADA